MFAYTECKTGPKKNLGVDPRPWVEMDLRPLKRAHTHESCHVPLKCLNQLAKLLGTEDVFITGFDLSPDDDGIDQVGYVQARGVKFKKGKR